MKIDLAYVRAHKGTTVLEIFSLCGLATLLVLAIWKLAFASGEVTTAEMVKFLIYPEEPAVTSSETAAKGEALAVEARIQEGIAQEVERDHVAAIIEALPSTIPPSVEAVPPLLPPSVRGQFTGGGCAGVELQMADHLEEMHRAEGRLSTAISALDGKIGERFQDAKIAKAEQDARLEAAVLRIASDVDDSRGLLWFVVGGLGLTGASQIPAFKRYVQTGDRRRREGEKEG